MKTVYKLLLLLGALTATSASFASLLSSPSVHLNTTLSGYTTEQIHHTQPSQQWLTGFVRDNH